MSGWRNVLRGGSVRFRLIAPVVAFCVLVALVSWVTPRWLATHLIGERLHERARSMALTVGYAAESGLRREGLSRLVNAIGAEGDVAHIVAIAGEPARVVASTRNAWVGLEPGALPVAYLAECAEASLGDRREAFGRFRGLHEVYASVPIDDRADLSLLTGGSVLVVLDASRVDAEVAMWSARIGGALLAGAMLVISVGMFVVHRVVLRPLDAIVGAIDGNREAPTPETRELALVAEAYNANRASAVRSAEEMARALEQVHEASRAKSAFLANMSHEIRTPMTAILGYIEILGDRLVSDPAEASEMMRAVRSNGEMLLTIINDILDVSRIEAGQLAVESIDTDPVRAVRDIVELFGRVAADRGIGVRMVRETPLPERSPADPTPLRQIVNNHVGNAVKFTERGGVTVRLSCDPAAERLTIAVEDTGRGMTAEERDAIARFRPFTQADSGVTRRFGGSGLGLCIANQLAERLGGGIVVESEAGVGSVFTVTVGTGDLSGVAMRDAREPGIDADAPVSTPSPTGTRQPASAALPDGLRILVAEDGPANQRLIRVRLERGGAAVVVCENGRVALDTIVSGETPDLVLMDMQMPEMDGYTASRELRAHGFGRPIIALTAHAMSGDRERCLAAGCSDYLSKPVSREKLHEMCVRWARGDDYGDGHGDGGTAAA